MMAYTKQTWTNDDPDTPLSASRLDHIETGIQDAHDALDDKADDSHTHAIADVTDLASRLSAIEGRLDELEGEG